MEEEYDLKLRLKLGLKRFGKGIAASLLITAVQFAAEFLQSNPGIFPEKYTLFVGAAVSALMGIEKALQKEK